jgi:hypothetical protein
MLLRFIPLPKTSDRSMSKSATEDAQLRMRSFLSVLDYGKRMNYLGGENDKEIPRGHFTLQDSS